MHLQLLHRGCPLSSHTIWRARWVCTKGQYYRATRSSDYRPRFGRNRVLKIVGSRAMSVNAARGGWCTVVRRHVTRNVCTPLHGVSGQWPVLSRISCRVSCSSAFEAIVFYCGLIDFNGRSFLKNNLNNLLSFEHCVNDRYIFFWNKKRLK